MGYCQSLSAKTVFFFLPSSSANCEWILCGKTRAPSSKHLPYEGPSDGRGNLKSFVGQIYGFKSAAPPPSSPQSVDLFSSCPLGGQSLRKRLWIIPISVTLQLNVIQRGSIGCCNSDARTPAHTHTKTLQFIYFCLSPMLSRSTLRWSIIKICFTRTLRVNRTGKSDLFYRLRLLRGNFSSE